MSLFEAKVKEDHGLAYLSVTHNGHQWTSIAIKNPEMEIPHIITELSKYLSGLYKEVDCGACTCALPEDCSCSFYKNGEAE